jgi:8-oxo-dGTP diphosphatase
MRTFGNRPIEGQHYIRRPGAYAIILADDGLLITRQTSPAPEWQLPGGGIDVGESILHGLHREVMEETGSTVSVIRKLGVYQSFTFIPEYDMWAHKICNIFLCKHGRQLGPPIEPHHEVAIMDIATASEQLTNAGDRFYVKRFLKY